MDEPTASRAVSFGPSLNARPKEHHERSCNCELEHDQDETQSAELEDVGEQEAHAEQSDADLEEKLVRVDARPEDRKELRAGENVSHEQAEDNGPEHVLDVGDCHVMRLAVRAQPALRAFACVADGEEKADPGKKA